MPSEAQQIINKMKNTEEFKEFKNEFNQLGITKEKEQKELFDFFYKLGKIIYSININSYGKEN